MYRITLNRGFGSAVRVGKLGEFKRGVTRELELSDAQRAQLSRGRMFTVEPAKKAKTKPPAAPAEE